MTFDSNDNLSAEQHNTLMLINKVIEKANMSFLHSVNKRQLSCKSHQRVTLLIVNYIVE